MKDNDIKMYFENAVEANEDTGIEPEKIKNRVMAELGKTAVANLTNPQNGEEVTPVFVKAPAKKFPKAKVITAAATAACLGVASISTGFFGLAGGASSPGSAEIEETTADSGYPTEEPSVDTDYPCETAFELPNYDGVEPIMSFKLLDGSDFKLIPDNRAAAIGPAEALDDNISTYILSEENGRLYFVKNAGEIDLFHKEKAVKEDITDKISSDNFYLYTYENPGNTVQQTHYVVIGGSLADNDYGYAELFKTDAERNQWVSCGHYSNEAPELPPLYPDSGTSGKPQWLINGVKAIEEQYGEKEIMRNGTGGLKHHIDFKNVWATNGEDKDPLQYEDGEETAPILLKSDKFTLLDGAEVVYDYDEDKFTFHSDINETKWLVMGDNGRVYFYGNGGKEEDITDIISTGKPYITSYKNGKSGVTHYIAVGGDPSIGDYGYAEFFEWSKGNWYYWHINTPAAEEYASKAPQWLDKAMEKLSNGSEDCDFDGYSRFEDLDNALSPSDFTAMKNDFRYGEIYGKKLEQLFDSMTPTDTTTLYDGSTLKEYTDDKGVTVTLLDRRNAADILTLENGRLFLNLNGEKTDITDKISREEPYIVKAENPYTNSTHYIAIGGEPKENGWGCVEIYKNGKQYSIPLNGYDFRNDNWFNNISDRLPADIANCETKPQVPDHILDKQPEE